MQYRLHGRQSAPVYNSQKQAGIPTCFSPPGQPIPHTSTAVWQIECPILLPHGSLSLFLFLLLTLSFLQTNLLVSHLDSRQLCCPSLAWILSPFYSVSCPVQPGILHLVLFPLIRADTAPLQPLLPSCALQDLRLAASGGSPTLSPPYLDSTFLQFCQTPPGFMTTLKVMESWGGGEGKFPDEFSLHHNMEMASTKGSGNVCGHGDTPA